MYICNLKTNIADSMKQWFPMRVTYSRQMKVKAYLDEHDIRSFVPMQYANYVENKRVKRKLVPAVNNLIFIFSDQKTITKLKQQTVECEPLRYMMQHSVVSDNPDTIMTVPTRQMENFIHATEVNMDEVVYLSADDLKGKVNAHVTITSGPFEGVEGVVRRVKGNKHVVVELEGFGGYVINFIPNAFILKK